MATEQLHFYKHEFILNPQDHSDEHVTFVTYFNYNGDPNGIYTTHQLKMRSCCNETIMDLSGFSISPSTLHRLADAIAKAHEIAVENNEE